MAKLDRREENERRIASYTDSLYCYRIGNDGIIRFATEADYENTLKADGYAPYDPSDEELRDMGPVPWFRRREGGN